MCITKHYSLVLPAFGMYIIGINLHVSSTLLLVALVAFHFHCCIVFHCVNVCSETGSSREGQCHWFWGGRSGCMKFNPHLQLQPFLLLKAFISSHHEYRDAQKGIELPSERHRIEWGETDT